MRELISTIDFKASLNSKADMKVAEDALVHHIMKGGVDPDLILIETKTGKAYLYKEKRYGISGNQRK